MSPRSKPEKGSKQGKAATEPSGLAHLYPDLPVGPDERLRFEFEGLAKTLAELALNRDNRTPFTVVVRGGWGRGKTTLLRGTERLLATPDEWLTGAGGQRIGKADRRRVETLWFNAWKYPSDDTVLAGLLGELLGKLRGGSLRKQLGAFVAQNKTAVALAALKSAAPAAVADLFEDVEGGGRFAEAIAPRAYHDTFRPLFLELQRILFHPRKGIRDLGSLAEEDLVRPEEAENEVLAIFLDDLDRCRPSRVAEVLEAINLFLDLPGVCFYLGLDWARLRRLLPEAVRDSGAQEEFLEKIVQVAFDLPEVSREDSRDYVKALIRETPLARYLTTPGAAEAGDGGPTEPSSPVEGAVEAADDAEDVAWVLGSRHPRHVKRFLNDLSIRLAVLRNTGHLEGHGTAGLVDEGDAARLKVQVPPAAVVAWHLLAEHLDDAEWRETSALVQNLEAFLREWGGRRRAAGKALEEGVAEGVNPAKKTEEVAAKAARDGGVGRVAQRQDAEARLDRHVKVLRGLSPAQREVLVHLATPQRPAAQKSPGSAGAFALDDLDSEAWVPLGGGQFQMGAEDISDDEKPVHPVRLSPFRIAKYPVTNADYRRYVLDGHPDAAPDHWDDGEIPEGKERHPVTHVSWEDASRYCEWLTRRIRKRSSPESGEGAHLPTEAQWEFAAAGKAGRRYPWGDEEPDGERANFGDPDGDTTKVDAFAAAGATPDGVCDLAGNVLEWCHDWFGTYDENPGLDPTGPEMYQGRGRVLRGGSFNYDPFYLRSAYRDFTHPGLRNYNFGFRVAWSLAGGLEKT